VSGAVSRNRGRTTEQMQVRWWRANGFLAETEAQRVAAGADVALLVVRRDGTADVGEWWAWLETRMLAWLTFAGQFQDFDAPQLPVRLIVADACRLLRAAGYGEPVERSEALPSAEDVRGILRQEWVDVGASARAAETVQGVSEYPEGLKVAQGGARPTARGIGDEP
jgi:hypothetical protein